MRTLWLLLLDSKDALVSMEKPHLLDIYFCYGQKNAKGYWISTSTVINQELFSEYVEKVGPWLKQVGGEVFAKDTEPQGKEQTKSANLAVICEFPSMRAAVDAYESAEYQELSKIRKAATENATFTIMEGMDEAEKLRSAMGK